MKLWQVAIVALIAGMSGAAVSGAMQPEAYKAGDRIGNRCFTGKYWKNCGEPDAPPPVIPPPTSLWRSVECYTNQCVADTLNGLPYASAAEAKLTTWKDITYVWHR